MQIDLLGKLDSFKDSFPVQYYKENFYTYLKWLAKNYILDEINCRPICEGILQGQYAERFKRIARIELISINKIRAAKGKAPRELPAFD